MSDYTALSVNKAVLLEILLPVPELIKPIVQELIVEAEPTKISVRINNTSFLHKLL